MDKKTLVYASLMIYLMVAIVGIVGYNSKNTGAAIATRWCECKIYRLDYFGKVATGPTFQYARASSPLAHTDQGCNNLCNTKFSSGREFLAIGRKEPLGFSPYPLRQTYLR